MFSSKLNQIYKEYYNYCKINDFDNINITFDKIVKELNYISKIKNKNKDLDLIKFKYLLKKYPDYILHIKDLNYYITLYGINILNKIKEVNSNNAILYFQENMLILDTNNLNNNDLLNLLKKFVSKNIVKYNTNSKEYYFILNNHKNDIYLFNHLKYYIKRYLSEVIIVQNNKINIFIGYESFIPQIHYLNYKHNGILFNISDFRIIVDINYAFEEIFHKLKLINPKFLNYLSKEITFKIPANYKYDLDEGEWSAFANKNKKIIQLELINSNNIKRLLSHEIGHFYYWKYNKNELNSKDFFNDFKKHYERIKREYDAHYFSFEPNGKYKFNKISEYFCEMFALYICEELSKEDVEIFKKYFRY